jgi:hypothetical protein
MKPAVCVTPAAALASAFASTPAEPSNAAADAAVAAAAAAPTLAGSRQPAAAAGVEAAAPCLLAASGLRHIVLASGHDIPLQLLPAGHLPAGVTLYGSYDYDADTLAELQVKFLVLSSCWHLVVVVELVCFNGEHVMLQTEGRA